MNNKIRKNIILDISIISIVTSIFVANILSIYFFKRLDLTEGNIYSLSDSSKNILSSLNDKLEIKCFFSQDLPPELKNIPSLIKDNLEEYKTYSNGNLSYKFIDPIKDQKDFEDQIIENQLPSAQVEILEKDEFKIKRVFLGMILTYKDRKEIIPYIRHTDLSTLEYEISSRIKKISSDEIYTIGVMKGYSTTELEKLKNLYQLVTQQYKVEEINVLSEKFTPDNVSVMLVISPKENLDNEALLALDQYIMKGGKVAFFIDKTNIKEETQYAKLNYTNIDSILKIYGVTVNNDLVGDANGSFITTTSQKGFYSMKNKLQYPFIPVITRLNKDNVITENIERLSLYFASSLDTTHALDADVKMEIIARTSDRSFSHSFPFNILADRDIEDYKYDKKYLPIITTLSGSFRSAFSDTKLYKMPDLILKSKKTRMIVSGDAEFFEDHKLNSIESLEIVLNMIDWLIADECLIAIRSKNITFRPLKFVNQTGRLYIKILNIATIPFFLIFLGFYRWLTEKKRKKFKL
ncbi:MAG: Gldg family protein [Candidatus Delongbacteria bacterium]|nr:Gldg family protein [Candidatus Delongbacteria bacterium]